MSNWIKIERDSSGLATEQCLLHIARSIPVIVTDVYDGEITETWIVQDNGYVDAWLNDIKTNPSRFTHYMPITLPQL